MGLAGTELGRLYRARFSAEDRSRKMRVWEVLVPEFFQRWIRETGVPQLRVSSRIEPDGRVAVVRVQQVGDVFDLPLTVSVQYAEGSTEKITIPVTDALTEYPIGLKGAVKRIDTKDELTLAEYVK